jgi:hypothetical protein
LLLVLAASDRKHSKRGATLMFIAPSHISVAALVAALLPSAAMAQAPPPPGPPRHTMFSDFTQLPETRGVVRQYTLTPRGDLDGFLLADNTDVHVPPHLSVELGAVVRPGDTVSVRGYRAGASPLIVAASVTNATTNQTVVDRGPPPPGFGPPPTPPPGYPAPGAQQASLSGKVQASLYGPAGDLNGAVLEDGTTIRFPPQLAYQFAGALMPGQATTVQGWLLSNGYGRVVEAHTVIGSAAQTNTGTSPPPRP